MSATLTDLIAQTRYYLDDDSYARFTDDEIKFYINYAYNYYHDLLVNKNYPRLLKTVDISLSNYLAALPSDFYKAKIVYSLNDTVLTPLQLYINYEEVEDINSGVCFDTYSFEGNNIKVSRIDATAIRLVYYKTLDDLDLNTDTVDNSFIPSWGKLIAIKAALLAKATREEDDTTEMIRMIEMLEIPFNDYVTKMTNSRSFVHPFII